MPGRLENGDGGGVPLRQIVTATTENEYLEHLIEALKVSDHAYLLSSLDRVTADRDHDIENICTHNHQEFITSVTGLDRVRQDFSNVGNDILQLVSAWQSSTDNLAAQKKNLVDSRSVLQNISETTSALKSLLEVLRLSNQIHELVGRQNHYAALRALDELQASLLLSDAGRYEVGIAIEASVPATQKMIAEAVLADLNTWLYRIRDVSQYIGEVAFYHTEQRRTRHKERIQASPYLAHYKLNSALELVADEQTEYDVLNDEEAQLFVDFTPLFEALHIHEALGQIERFRAEYASTRRKQRDLLLPHQLSLKDEEVSELKGLLEGIAGFAIVEKATLRKTEGLRTNADVDELWDSLCQGAVSLIQAAVLGLDNSDVLLRVTSVVSLFIQTMESWQLHSSSLSALLATLFNRYILLLKRRCIDDIQEIISSDDYMPMPVNDEEEYEHIIDRTWYEPDKPRSEISFPAVFPFSQMYPMCCIDIRDYLSRVFSAPDDYLQGSADANETIRNSLDELLTLHICTPLTTRLTSKYPGQIVQILTNFEHFENASRHLEKELLVNPDTGGFGSKAGGRLLTATEKFRQGRKKAEKRVFELVNEKIDELLDTAEYDWMSTQQPSEPSNYMTELTQYLSNIMGSVLLGLPDEIKELCYLDALTHAATAILTLPLDPSAPSISPPALHQLALDVSHLNTFVSSLSLATTAAYPTRDSAEEHATPQTLHTTLSSLTQTVDLLTSDTPDDFFNVETKNVKYPLVDPLNGPVLLEKVEAGREVVAATEREREREREREMERERPGTPPAVGTAGVGVGSSAGGQGTAGTTGGDGAGGGSGGGGVAGTLEAKMKAGSERFMRGLRGKGEGSGGGSSGTAG